MEKQRGKKPEEHIGLAFNLYCREQMQLIKQVNKRFENKGHQVALHLYTIDL